MTRTVLKSVMAGLIAATVGSTAFVAPASASGQVSITVRPQNADQDRAMRTGLAIYSIVNQVKGGAAVRQKGKNNSAGIAQNGKGNLGIVHQEGKGHNGTLTQNGNGNAHGLFQFGKNTNGHVTQNGGGTGATFQFGW